MALIDYVVAFGLKKLAFFSLQCYLFFITLSFLETICSAESYDLVLVQAVAPGWTMVLVQYREAHLKQSHFIQLVASRDWIFLNILN